jgi:hypothetical protein
MLLQCYRIVYQDVKILFGTTIIQQLFHSSSRIGLDRTHHNFAGRNLLKVIAPMKNGVFWMSMSFEWHLPVLY